MDQGDQTSSFLLLHVLLFNLVTKKFSINTKSTYFKYSEKLE